MSTAFAVAAGCSIVAALLARRRTKLRTDPRTERRLRFWNGGLGGWLFRLAGLRLAPSEGFPTSAALSPVVTPATPVTPVWGGGGGVGGRSEEHTSELQSHVNLVCRLLLEKKKKEAVAGEG